MSWKIAKLLPSDFLFSFTAYYKKFFHSITFRMAFISAISSFGLLAFLNIFLYFNFSKQLQLQNKRFLEHSIEILQQLLIQQNIEPRKSNSLKDEIVLEAPIGHYYARVVDDKNHIILETPGMSNFIPTSAFTNLTPQTSIIFATKNYLPPNIHKKKLQYFLLIQDIAKVSSGNHVLYIQVAKGISTTYRLLEAYRKNMATILLLGIFASALMGIIIAKRSLKPLMAITKSTQSITANHLKERIKPDKLPNELSTLATAFNNMLSRIENGFLRLSQFSDNLAHEFRTPVTNLMIAAEIILSKPRTEEEYRATLESTLEECQRLSHMIDNLLFLARAENPQEIIHTSTIEINYLFKNICDFYQAAAEEQSVALSYYGDGLIKAEPTLLRRAITNLLSNAFKNSLPGGVIKLSAKIVEDHSIHISVSDTGKGIPAEHLSNLFIRFYRVDSARDKNSGGTGLGLALVKSIMDLHHGKVNIMSELQKGTTVTLIFPA